MRAILGIGNPGKRYSLNRHNAGFMLLDYFADQHSISFSPSKNDYNLATGNILDFSYLLVKPTTYVNESGIAAKQVMDNYPDLNIEDFLVVVDDVNIETGSFKIKSSGSDGGHNGLSSLIYHLNSDQFPRIRIGIGNKFEKGLMASYVLSNFQKEEMNLIKKCFDDSTFLIKEFVLGGIKQMLDSNSRLSGKERNNKLDNHPNGESDNEHTS